VPVLGIDQLRGDADVFATLAHAAFQDTAHAELPTDLLVRVARPV
jgi:hypothetical protein